MDRAFVGDLHQSLALIIIERAFDLDHAVDLVEHAGAGFAFGAIFGVDLVMLQRHRDAIERQRLAVGIEPHGHGGAGAEACEQEVIRSGAGVLAANRDRFIGQHAVRPQRDSLLQFAVAGFAHHDVARGRAGLDRGRDDIRLDIALGPCSNDVGGIGRVGLAAQEMVGAGERDKAFWVPGGDEDLGGVFDADGVVGRRMHDQQCLVQCFDPRHQLLLGDIIEEFALDAERPAGERNLDLAMLADAIDVVLEKVRDVGGIRRGGNGDHGLRLGNLAGGGEDRGAAEAVADHERRRLSRLAQMVGGAHEIGDVGGKRRIGKIALAGAEAREVEPQHGDALGGQCHGNAFGRQHILAAGEAMRKQRIGVNLAVGRIECGGELMALRARELEAFSRHGRSPCGYVSVVRIALFGPGVTAVVIAADLPIARRICTREFDRLQPLCALPEIEMRHHQPHRAAML